MFGPPLDGTNNQPNLARLLIVLNRKTQFPSSSNDRFPTTRYIPATRARGSFQIHDGSFGLFKFNIDWERTRVATLLLSVVPLRFSVQHVRAATAAINNWDNKAETENDVPFLICSQHTHRDRRTMRPAFRYGVILRVTRSG